MTAKFLLARCLEKINVTDFLDKSSYTNYDKSILDPLLKAMNIVYEEFICDYFPLITDEEVNLKNGVCLTKSLEKQIIYPISLMKDGQKVAFVAEVNGIRADIEGKATLRYAYMPAEKIDVNGEIEMGLMPLDTLTDGIVAQYYLINKAFDLAQLYDARYRKKLWALRYKGKNLMLKERRWG